MKIFVFIQMQILKIFCGLITRIIQPRCHFSDSFQAFTTQGLTTDPILIVIQSPVLHSLKRKSKRNIP